MLLLLSFVSALSPVEAASQPLQAFNGCINRSYSGSSSLGIDLGTITFHFCTHGISWFDNWAPIHNLTMLISTIEGLTPSVTTSQNSTTIDYHLIAPSALHAFSGDMYFTQKGYSQLVIIKGLFAGSVSTFPMLYRFTAPNAISWGGASVLNYNHLGFDWSADAGLATFTNSSKTLTFTVGNTVNIDPLTTDGANSVKCAAANTCAVTLTTSNTNDIVVWAANSAAAAKCVVSVASNISPDLVYHTIAQEAANGDCAQVYWAYSAAAIASKTFTATLATSVTAIQAEVIFGVTGAYTASPIDPLVSALGYQVNTGTGSGTPGTNCQMAAADTTTFANDMLIESCEFTNPTTVDHDTGYSFCCTTTGSPKSNIQYEVVSATTSSFQPTMTQTTNTAGWDGIQFAITANYAASVTFIPSISLSPSFSPTSTLYRTFMPPTGAPPMVDDSDMRSRTCTGSTTCQTLIIMTPNAANELMYCQGYSSTASDSITFTSSPSLTWNPRASATTTGLTLATAYAYNPSTVSNYLITEHASSGTLSLICTIIGPENGVIFFDPNASIVATGTCSSSCSQPSLSSISTNFPHDMMLGFFGATGSGSTWTAQPGYTPGLSTAKALEEYASFSSDFSSATIGATWSATPTTWVGIVDAVTADTQSPVLAETFSKTITPNAFANSLSLTPVFSRALSVSLTFPISSSLNSVFKQAITIARTFTGNLNLQPVFVPCKGCGGGGTTTTTITIFSGTNQPNYLWLLALPMALIIFMVLFLVRRK